MAQQRRRGVMRTVRFYYFVPCRHPILLNVVEGSIQIGLFRDFLLGIFFYFSAPLDTLHALGKVTVKLTLVE